MLNFVRYVAMFIFGKYYFVKKEGGSWRKKWN